MLLKWSSYGLMMSSTVFPDFIPLWLGASFFSIQLIQIDLSQMKWNKLFSLFFYEETAETTIWWNVNINLQSVHFYEQVQNKWAVFMGLTSVSSMLLSLKFQLLFKFSIDFCWKLHQMTRHHKVHRGLLVGCIVKLIGIKMKDKRDWIMANFP